MTGELQQEQKRREVLDRLYPWYKEEVFRRRERMIWLTAFGGATLVVVLLFVPVVPAARSPLLKAMACVGVVLFNGTMAALILQQAERHRLAKQALIRIERPSGCMGKADILRRLCCRRCVWSAMSRRQSGFRRPPPPLLRSSQRCTWCWCPCSWAV